MAYPPPAASRRPRRRATAVFLLLLAVTLGVVALAVRFRTERRDAIDYLAVAKEIADDEIAMASSLSDLLKSLDDLDRPDILNRLAALEVEAGDLLQMLEETTVTAAVGEVNGFFVVALTSWNSAVAGLDDAIVEILDGEGDGRLGDSMLAGAFADLRVGDRAYSRFREAVRLLDAELRAPEYPEFSYVDREVEVLYDATVISDRLRATLRFVENRDISVRATTDPEPLGSANGVPVVPDSETFIVQVVITNEGNVAAESIMVSASVVPFAGTTSDDRSEMVDLLTPGEATTVVFAGFVLASGEGYRLRVEATVADDDVPDNNVWELDFIRNEP